MICQLRIDDRLIHGQVAIAWTRELKINGIVVISDGAANDKIRTLSLSLAKPLDTDLMILSVEDGIQFLKSEKAEKYRLLVIIENSADALRILQEVKGINSLNVGGMRKTEGKEMISKSVAVDKKDIENFRKILDSGIEIEIRQVPSETKIFINDILKLSGGKNDNKSTSM